MKGNDVHRLKEVNEAMHGVKQWKPHLSERRPKRTVRREFNGSSESSGERSKKRKGAIVTLPPY